MDDCFHFDDDCHFCNEIDGSNLGKFDRNRTSELFQEDPKTAVETMSLGEDFFVHKEPEIVDNVEPDSKSQSSELITGFKKVWKNFIRCLKYFP